MCEDSAAQLIKNEENGTHHFSSPSATLAAWALIYHL